MLVRRITKHVKDQNWFAVVLDFIIVIVGILIAFKITNWNEQQQGKANLANAEIAINSDLMDTYFASNERLSLADCRIESLRALGELLLEPVTQWQGLPRQDADHEKRQSFKNVLRSPSRTWGSRIWDAELARGIFNPIDSKRRGQLDRTFEQANTAEKLQNDINDLEANLMVLAHDIELPWSDRLRYFEVLSKIDRKSASLENISKQIAERIEAIGLDLNQEQRQALLESLAEQHKAGVAIYGECRQLMTYPALQEPDLISKRKKKE